MAVLREYKLTKDVWDILQDKQIEIFGEDTFWIEDKNQTWEGVEDIADRYGWRTSDNPDDAKWEMPPEVREAILFDEFFAPYIECIREKELAPAEPGHMYNIDGAAKSFSEVTWGERFGQANERCRHCHNGYYGDEEFFPLVVEEDDGSQTLHWTLCEGVWELPDNLGEVMSWGEDGSPRGLVGCDGFEWS